MLHLSYSTLKYTECFSVAGPKINYCNSMSLNRRKKTSTPLKREEKTDLKNTFKMLKTAVRLKKRYQETDMTLSEQQ